MHRQRASLCSLGLDEGRRLTAPSASLDRWTISKGLCLPQAFMGHARLLKRHGIISLLIRSAQ